MRDLATVFGGSGFIGRHAVRALAKAGWRIRVAVRRPGLAYELPMLGDVGQIEIVQANLRDAESVARALDGALACVNAVGLLYETGRQTFHSVHVEGAERVAQSAAAAGARHLVHVSAIGADVNGAALYARSKAVGEAAVRAAFPAATILRPSVVFGPEDDFFNRFAQMAVTAPVLPLIGGGQTRFQPVFVADVAQAVMRSLDIADAAGGVFELGGPGVYSFEDLMRLTLAVIQRRRPLVKISMGAARALGRLGDFMARTGVLVPPLTSDQVAMLQVDNVVAAGARGLADLGVAASAAEPILPTYLYRFRPKGQYADSLAAAAPRPAG